MLAELASGRPPFEAEETTALLEGHLHDQPSLGDHAPPVLANVILRLLAKSPGDRYLSAAQAREALLAVGDKVGLALPPARGAEPAPLEMAPTRSMRPHLEASRWQIGRAHV